MPALYLATVNEKQTPRTLITKFLQMNGTIPYFFTFPKRAKYNYCNTSMH